MQTAVITIGILCPVKAWNIQALVLTYATVFKKGRGGGDMMRNAFLTFTISFAGNNLSSAYKVMPEPGPMPPVQHFELVFTRG